MCGTTQFHCERNVDLGRKCRWEYSIKLIHIGTRKFPVRNDGNKVSSEHVSCRFVIFSLTQVLKF